MRLRSFTAFARRSAAAARAGLGLRTSGGVRWSGAASRRPRDQSKAARAGGTCSERARAATAAGGAGGRTSQRSAGVPCLAAVVAVAGLGVVMASDPRLLPRQAEPAALRVPQASSSFVVVSVVRAVVGAAGGRVGLVLRPAVGDHGVFGVRIRAGVGDRNGGHGLQLDQALLEALHFAAPALGQQ